MRSNSKHLLSILIPVKNEKANIKMMLKILISVLESSHEIIIIYDSQGDSSIGAANKIKKNHSQIKIIRNKYGKGVANAIKSGVDASNGKYILIFAADDVGPVLAIKDMINLMDKGCNLVSCTRYAYGGRRLGGSIIESFLSRIANFLFHAIIRSAFTDSTTGIKMFRKELFNQINLESNVGWAFVFEMAIKAQEKRLKLGEVPIISIDRLYGGKSNFKLGPWIKEYLKWFIYGIYHLQFSRPQKKVMVRIPKSIV